MTATRPQPDSDSVGPNRALLDTSEALLETHKTQKTPLRLNLDGNLLDISDFDQYGFEVHSPDLAAGFNPEFAPLTIFGSIVSEDASGQTINTDIQFRTRRVDGDRVRLAFYDLSIQVREQLDAIRASLSGNAKDELHNLSYDDLAKGGSNKKPDVAVAKPAKAGFVKKAVAMAMLAGSMVLVVGWVVYMVNSRSSVAVSNSVMMGNYMPINSPQQAQLTEILVETGQSVKAGQILARLSNELAITELQLVEAKLSRAQSEVVAYELEAEELSDAFDYLERKVARDLGVAVAEMSGSDAKVIAAEAQLKRLEPLVKKRSLIVAELDDAKVTLALAKAEKQRHAAVIESLNFAKDAAKSKVLINDNGASSPLGELQTKIMLARAASEELKASREVLQKLAAPIELHSPVDGKVYAIYRSEGETLKVADQMMAVSAQESGWAIGHVADYLAPEVRPGHPVEVEFPSLNITTTGTIEGIGHRAVYERGGYNADFRGGPLDVPIRVAVDLKGQEIPTGIRLNMNVRVRDPLGEFQDWLDEKKSWMKEKIAKQWPSIDSSKKVEVAMNE